MKTDYMTEQHLLETEQTPDFLKENHVFSVLLEESIRRGNFKDYNGHIQNTFIDELAPYIIADIEICKLYQAVHVSDLIRAAANLGVPSNLTENLKKEYFGQIIKSTCTKELQQVANDLVTRLEQEYKKYNLSHYSYTIQRAIEYINTRRFQAISTSDVADYLKVEQSNLSKSFHQEVGMTVMNYIHTMKTDMARALILRHNYSLMEISDMLGYSSYHYFCKVFKKYQGCLPSKVK